MCRNIHNLFNFDPPATTEEIQAAALQYVRKVSGFTKPSIVNETAFNQAVDEITIATKKLIDHLTTTAAPKDREVEAERRRERSKQRFGSK